MSKFFFIIFIEVLLFANTSQVYAQVQLPSPIKSDVSNPNNCYNENVNMVVPNGNNILAATPSSTFK